MRLADRVELDDVMATVRAERPVFHSEADFQHHLAWHIHLAVPDLRLRLEVRPDPVLREQVDILVEDPAAGRGSVLELKYLKAAFEGTWADEAFHLRNAGARDIVRYDVVKDLWRVERFVAARPGWNGAAIVLSNDAAHWRAPVGARVTIAEAFRIHEGAELSGARAWGGNAGPGTTRGREAELGLTGFYIARWQDFSHLDGRNGAFRLLVVPVEAAR